ncbi:hypothetical protein LWI29_011594 [Acer saccharum]|uniref:25S rRNA (uridine-N(3))-methyltransferase BMT5-like domain-containing protein n=1 Tax=Acer saccharum TaxID=4024 RepID=A0AA39VRJ7_ACESA|nr:hypothetical protein LWI29_011594 [Acer saccharum]
MVASSIDTQENISSKYSNGLRNVIELEERGCKVEQGIGKGFLKNAKVMLKEGKGEIHVSHKEGDPYDKWELVNKAEKIGLIIHQVVPFCKQDYPGYHNKRAQGNNSDAPFPLGDCSTYKFRKLDQNGH